jgi:triphosphoribosyl-dephospho-CoA synthase
VLSPGLFAQTACIWEATARKPGNVHRFVDFADLAYTDFLLSAAAIAPVLDQAPGRPLGQTILQAIQATRQVVATNSNLGIVLLLAPLAAVPPGQTIRAGLPDVLANTTVEDARDVYAAIRLAAPGGLGDAPEQDVRDEPTRTLREVMALAADRDRIAAQYTNDFFDVQEMLSAGIAMALDRWGGLELAIVATFLAELADAHDSLIVRKRGVRVAEEVRRRSLAVFEAGWPDSPLGWEEFHTFDTWLREPGTGRNPGTTADLVAASLFLLLREGTITLPSPHPWSAGWDHD